MSIRFPALMEDWALSLKEAIAERGKGNREWLAPEIPEEYKERFKQKAIREALEREERAKIKK